MSQKNARAERQEDKPAPSKFIVWARDFLDDRQRKVRQLVVVAGVPPPGFVHFIGIHKADLMAKAGITTIPFTFNIPGAADVVEAFARWDAEYQKNVEEANRKIIRARPGDLPPGGRRPH